MISSLNWAPAKPTERYAPIDILRGLALFGVLIVNLETGFRLPLLEQILKHPAEVGWADQAVNLLVIRLFEFKAITIFSFLFGVGIAMQAERFRSPGARRFLCRRLGWLLVLGATHLFLIWDGDILTLYAVCGFLLLPSLGLRWQTLALIGAAAMVFPEFIQIAPSIPGGDAATLEIARARDVYGNGGVVSVLAYRWHESWVLIFPLEISILPRTVGLMYLGMAAWRSGILREPERHRAKLLAALAFGTVAGIVDPSTPSLLALAYGSALLLSLTPRRAAWLSGIAATGRMALTNYLVQSIILGFLFYGYGFGLFRRTGSAAGAAIGVAIYVAQIQLSRRWLDRFQFGPFEWLWRSLTYGRRQPMRRELF